MTQQMCLRWAARATVMAPHGQRGAVRGRPEPAPCVLRLAEERRPHSERSTSSGMVAGSVDGDHLRICAHSPKLARTNGTLIGPLTVRPSLSSTSKVRGQLLAESARARDFAAEILSAVANSLLMSWFLGYRMMAVNILVQPPSDKAVNLGVMGRLGGKSLRLSRLHGFQFRAAGHPTARPLGAPCVAYVLSVFVVFHISILNCMLDIVKRYF